MTLLLTRADVASLLDLADCIGPVEDAFRSHGEGRAARPGVLGMRAVDGGFHIKAACLGGFFAAKMNANFMHNRERRGRPNIQGLIVLADAETGTPLAVMDSIEITIVRTGAATAVAAKHLARSNTRIVTVCGCGEQGRIQLRALSAVRPIARAHAFDVDPERARRFGQEVGTALGIDVAPASDLERALRESDACVTCTPSKRAIINRGDVRPGTFIAAVGADNEEKQEIDPQLLASSKVVADILDQCAEIGDLHHAIEAGLMTKGDVHAELGEIVAGRKPGRTSDDEVTVFDSTGTALQDVAAAALVYTRALERGVGQTIAFSDR
jgi:alanine dehydrogenase